MGEASGPGSPTSAFAVIFVVAAAEALNAADAAREGLGYEEVPGTAGAAPFAFATCFLL